MKEMETRKTAPTAPALEKGLDVIELLAAMGRPMTLREIAEQLGRSKNELFRMVHVLTERGYVVREGAEGLTLTSKLFDIGLKTPRTRDLVSVATPMMQALAREVLQSVHLVVANHGETVVIAAASGNEDMNFSLKLGYRRPLADAHSGLVMLAFQPDEGRARLLAQSMELMRAKPDRKVIDADMQSIRRDGYLIRPSRDLVGVTDIVAPILVGQEEAIATLVVSYLDRHKTAPQEHEAVRGPLLRVCADLARRLVAGSTAEG